MSLRIFVIDNEAREAAARVVEFASKPENRYVASPEPRAIPGDNPAFVVHISGFRCAHQWFPVRFHLD